MLKTHDAVCNFLILFLFSSNTLFFCNAEMLSLELAAPSCTVQRYSTLRPAEQANPPATKGRLVLPQQIETFLLPQLPCSSLCFCPLNFSHCWQSPAPELQKSVGGAFLQCCRLPIPVWVPYLFTPPE